MSREIKFRFWDINNKKWADGMGIYSDGIIGDFSECFHNVAGDNGEFYIAQQFTGSSDEHGREIFEGDILKRAYNVECFKMSDGTTLEGCIPGNLSIEKENFSVVEWKGIGFDLGGITRIGWRQKSSPRVVGNIFEHPELLTHEP